MSVCFSALSFFAHNSLLFVRYIGDPQAPFKIYAQFMTPTRLFPESRRNLV